MPNIPTPGQVNYTAYCAALRPSIVRYLAAMYGHLEPGEQAAWPITPEHVACGACGQTYEGQAIQVEEAHV